MKRLNKLFGTLLLTAVLVACGDSLTEFPTEPTLSKYPPSCEECLSATWTWTHEYTDYTSINCPVGQQASYNNPVISYLSNTSQSNPKIAYGRTGHINMWGIFDGGNFCDTYKLGYAVKVVLYFDQYLNPGYSKEEYLRGHMGWSDKYYCESQQWRLHNATSGPESWTWPAFYSSGGCDIGENLKSHVHKMSFTNTHPTKAVLFKLVITSANGLGSLSSSSAKTYWIKLYPYQ